jgi:hypothetical protein
LSVDTKKQTAEQQTVVDKLNKSGDDPMKEFKLGVGFVDGTVSKIDSSIKSISKKIHGKTEK